MAGVGKRALSIKLTWKGAPDKIVELLKEIDVTDENDLRDITLGVRQRYIESYVATVIKAGESYPRVEWEGAH